MEPQHVSRCFVALSTSLLICVRVPGCRALQQGFGGATGSKACELRPTSHTPQYVDSNIAHLRLAPVSSSGTRGCVVLAHSSSDPRPSSEPRVASVILWSFFSVLAVVGMYRPTHVRHRCAVGWWLCVRSAAVGSVSCHSCTLGHVWCMTTPSIRHEGNAG